jgi:hypothetical protein
MRRVAVRGVVAALVVWLAWPAAGAPLHGQVQQDFLSGPRFGFGYSGVIPDVLAGAGVWYLTGPRRFGVFVDAKMTTPNPENEQNFCPPRLGGPCTLEWVQANYNHDMLRDREHWMALNAGGMYALSREFALMVGAGLVRVNRSREFIDMEEEDSLRITWEGNYLVPHPDWDTWGVQATVGGMLRAGNRIAFSFGYETGIGGMSVGLFVVVP